MSNDIIKNNQVTIIGEIASGFSFSHEFQGEKFYNVDVKVQRLSDTYDYIPVIVSDRLTDVKKDHIGILVKVTGQFRSHNKHEETRSRLVLTVFARDIEVVDHVDVGSDSNHIYLDCYICKKPFYRNTPLGREITDLFVAVNRPYGKSDYIPCICWGRNARYAETLNPGTRLVVEGRIQSREYVKKLSDGVEELRTAYEVSVSKIEVIDDEEQSD